MWSLTFAIPADVQTRGPAQATLPFLSQASTHPPLTSHCGWFEMPVGFCTPKRCTSHPESALSPSKPQHLGTAPHFAHRCAAQVSHEHSLLPRPFPSDSAVTALVSGGSGMRTHTVPLSHPETNPHLVGKSPEVSHVCAALRSSVATPGGPWIPP